MSIVGGILVCVVLLIRLFVFAKMPKRTLVFMWCVVLFGLLVPLSLRLPAEVSVPFMQIQESIGLMAETQLSVQTFASEDPINNTSLEMPAFAWTPTHTFATTQAPPRAFSVIQVFLIIWLIGIVSAAVLFFSAYYRKLWEFRKA